MSTWHTRWWHSQRWGKAQLAHHCTRAVRRSQSEQSRLPTRRRVVYARVSAGGTCVRCACTDPLWVHGYVFEEELSKLVSDQCMKNTCTHAHSVRMCTPEKLSRWQGFLGLWNWYGCSNVYCGLLTQWVLHFFSFLFSPHMFFFLF